MRSSVTAVTWRRRQPVTNVPKEMKYINPAYNNAYGREANLIAILWPAAGPALAAWP